MPSAAENVEENYIDMTSTHRTLSAAHYIYIVAALLWGLALPANAQSQRTVTHEVKKGETLYKLSKDYGVSVDDIIQSNPVLQTELLKAGQSLTIALPSQVSAVPLEGGSDTMAAPAPAQAPRPVRTSPTAYKVKKGETLWSISRAFGITVDELMAANPEMQQAGYKLKKGRSITIPADKELPAAKPTTGLSVINIAVVLPFKAKGIEAARSTEYLRGMMLGIAQLKKQGRSIVLRVFDEPASGETLRPVMERINAQETNLIVGPIYPSHWSEAIALSTTQTKIVAPFSSKIQQINTCPRLFMLNVPQSSEALLIADLVASSFHKEDAHFIFITHGEANAKADRRNIAAQLKKRLADDGFKITQLAAGAGLTAIKPALQNGAFNLVVTDASDADTQMQLQSAVTALQQTLAPGTSLGLLGYENWPEQAAGNSALRNGLYSSNTFVAATAFYFPYTKASMAFEADYKKYFGTDLLRATPRMAPLGYDTALAFINGLAAYGKDFGTQAQQLPFLQSNLRFAKTGGQGGYISRSAWLIHYKTDKSIDKIAKTR